MTETSFEPGSDPIALFVRWFAEAKAAGQVMPEAASLATATRDGAPSVRMVLFRGFVRGAFTFYTNYQSRKAVELEQNPRASLCFHWPARGQQVRVEGAVSRTSREDSEAYFRGRPRDSQLGAWASPQSRPLASRGELLALLERERERFEGQEVACPPHWGGYRLIPERIELWQEGGARLHDRFVYTRAGEGWHVERLGP